MEKLVIDFMLNFVQQYPWGAIVIVVMGVARMVFKPAIALLDSYVLATPTTADDEWERSFKSGKVYFALDYLFSIKIPEVEKK